MRGKMREVRDRNSFISDLAGKFKNLLMGELQKIVQNAKFMHYLKCGRMDGVTAEIAQEIRVFFEHIHIDAPSGKEITQHHAGGPSPGDATARLYRLIHSLGTQ